MGFLGPEGPLLPITKVNSHRMLGLERRLNYSYIAVWKIHQEGHGAIDGVLACGACSPGFDSRDILMFFPRYKAEGKVGASHDKNPYGHISLKVPNVKFDFDVSVDRMQLLMHASKT